MTWLGRLLGPAPEKTTARDLASGLALTVGRRTQVLIEFLKAEGLAQRALQEQLK